MRLSSSTSHWKISKWPIAIVAVCYLGELPWILLMDVHRGPFRSIYGFSILRVQLAYALGSDSPSQNIFGWLADLDKLVPYIAATVVYFTVRALLRWIPAESSGKLLVRATSCSRYPHLPDRLPPWITIFGLLGATIITIHYVTSPSGHFTSYQDKGVLDAFNHMVEGSSLRPWIFLAIYRINYLLLAPVVYFILFYYTALAVHIALYFSRQQSDTASVVATWAIVVAGVPGSLLLLLHDVANVIYGLGPYNANSASRHILMWLLFGLFMLAFPIIVIRIRRGRRTFTFHSPMPSDLKDEAELTEPTFILTLRTQYSRLSGRLPWALSAILIALPPFHILKFETRSPPLNNAINKSWHFYEDYTLLPSAAGEFDNAIESLLKPASKALTATVKDTKSPEYQALLMATYSLIRLGLAPREFELLCSGAVADDSLSRTLVSRSISCFPMYFRSIDGRNRFAQNVREMIYSWRTSYAANTGNWANAEVSTDCQGLYLEIARTALIRYPCQPKTSAKRSLRSASTFASRVTSSSTLTHGHDGGKK